MRKTNCKKMAFALGAVMALSLGAGIALQGDVVKGIAAETTETVAMFDGASVRLSTEAGGAGIRFSAKVSNYDVENGYTYGMLIIPEVWFETYSLNNDYHAKFAQAGLGEEDFADMTCVPQLGDFDGDGAEEYFIQGSLVGLKYTNSNVSFVGVGYIKDGETYTYASYDQAKNSRTMTNVAATVIHYYEKNTVGYNTCAQYIHRGVNEYNDVEYSEDVNETSDYAVTVNTNKLTLGVGETGTLSVKQSPAMGFVSKYTSSDETVAEVDANGVVTAKKAGTCTVTVATATEENTVNVIVRPIVGEFLQSKGSTTYANGTYTPSSSSSMMLSRETGFERGTISATFTYTGKSAGSGTDAGLVFGLTENVTTQEYIRNIDAPHYVASIVSTNDTSVVVALYKVETEIASGSLAVYTKLKSVEIKTDADEDGVVDFYGTAEEIAANTSVSHSLAASWDGKNIKVFLDGALKFTYTDSAPYTGTGYGLWTYNWNNKTARPAISDFQKSELYIAYGDDVNFASGAYGERLSDTDTDGRNEFLMTKSSGLASGSIEMTIDITNASTKSVASNGDGAGIVFGLTDVGAHTYVGKWAPNSTSWTGSYYVFLLNPWGQVKLLFNGTSSYGVVASKKFTDVGMTATKKATLKVEYNGTNIRCYAKNGDNWVLMIETTNTKNYTGTGYGVYGCANATFSDMKVTPAV